MKKLPELSVFFPFWNEEKNIARVVESAIPIAKEYAEKWEIIMVDDGSADKTLEKAKDLVKKHKHLRVISHQPNRGYGAALKEGLTSAKYKYIVFTDGDGQFDFSQLNRFVERIRGNDMVIGYRKKRQDTGITVRLALAYLLKVWDWILFRFRVKDIDCGFKMFKKEAIEQLMPLRSEGAMITTEILAKAHAKGLKIEQVGVDHFPRKYGKQSGANMQVVVRALFESLILWWDIKNSRF